MVGKFFRFINLHFGEEDKQKVLENVTENISFRGSNLWILACAIVIASVGLNVNSTAVIIGAMLISPLMGPIVGAGFALGTYNFQLLKRSMKNLLIATLVSLLVSFIYFSLSPFKETQSELLARTAPNIYDVLIAFFGGLVGVIAITRVKQGNPVPGVAIATALMPPLCTAGYALSVAKWSYFIGAFYLYTINCFFICIATFLIIKYLRYQPVKLVDRKYERQIRFGISALIIIMILPSSYLAYNLLNEKKFSQSVDNFINNEFTQKGYTMIYKKVNYNSSPKKIELAFLSKKFDKKELDSINQKLKNLGISNTELIIKQDATDLKSEILNEIGQRNSAVSEKDLIINRLRQQLDRYTIKDSSLIKEINILFPDFNHISIGKVTNFPNTDSANVSTVVLYQSEKEEKEQEEKMKKWISEKLSDKNAKVIRQ
ncbi:MULTISPECIES: DUF389 domain-containing protein [Chryseobacterium]|uniref:DUF389 domain-containing protein n=1 Tax=Chryseobacterium candidae TaxID=1978493 RepID=A0ABY2R686_9FLAO|nr:MULTISPECIES: DUF389 domain-containing protein [Chryseobacterium]PXW14460.1 putative hydrophobic protein (TIGR00271 family) [Chryseobacterium sp. CBTAP 102]THV56683.1 DUF389 domain-containing protein [Chryseobacterium candidae]SIQ32975.1 uncharacterized hydrophobic domain-containing protein [Chryseobacterium sp. RU33C]